ncbi:unnamed protein product [Owenia fusiformis]|uniref:Uncharacterized protein n=1 Tax=Owenia fusiformis TaxID=6347 RepID=A0A8J1XTN0_OWEFU|nr:unnamed protein product [Owenia fusiformis]
MALSRIWCPKGVRNSLQTPVVVWKQMTYQVEPILPHSQILCVQRTFEHQSRDRHQFSCYSTISTHDSWTRTNHPAFRYFSTTYPAFVDQKSTASKDSDITEKVIEANESKEIEEAEKPPGLFKRFKLAYKEYGKVLIGVHLVTSAVWFGSFFYLAQGGIDVVSILEKYQFNETLIKPFKGPGLGYVAVAYLMYKLATPLRYTVTLGGTQIAVKYLRQAGYLPPVAHQDKIRNLMKDGRQQLKDKSADLKDQLKEKHGDLKDQLKERKDSLKDKKDEWKEKIKDRSSSRKNNPDS